tara:strand:+ start:552 stop:755 length:204 start_codon:yes stop_codon:yes gene_type:complete
MSKIEDYRDNFDETEEFLSGMIAALDEIDANCGGEYGGEAWSDAKYDLYRTVGNAVSDYWEATRVKI